MRAAQEELWEVAGAQHGYLTAQQALQHGVSRGAVDHLLNRGTLERAGFGVYRFRRYPVSEADRYMLAVLWTRAPEAALSHESALDVYELSDINPDVIHVTVGRHRRLRRQGGSDYEIHYDDLEPHQVGWWQEVPTVTAATAIEQCIAYGTPAYLLRQAIDCGYQQGRLSTPDRDRLRGSLAES